jgi:hypothetical protein
MSMAVTMMLVSSAKTRYVICVTFPNLANITYHYFVEQKFSQSIPELFD